jgi:hypothetical protein
MMNGGQINVHPRPGPLPPERENYSPSFKLSCDWICRTVDREEQSVRWLFPLPGGEGQGEGGLGLYLHFLNP